MVNDLVLVKEGFPKKQCPILRHGLPGGSVVKNLPASAGDAGLIPELGRYPKEGNGNPLQYYRLRNPKDRGAWWARAHGVSKKELDVT